MALKPENIDHLKRERAWWLKLIESVGDGTYGVTHTVNGERLDDREESLQRFRDAAQGIEAVLTAEGVAFDA